MYTKMKILHSMITVLVFSFSSVFALLYSEKFKNLIPPLQQIGYTEKQIKSIEELLKDAVDINLPEKYLYNRVREGISKKVEYIVLYTALIDKISKLRIARVLITEFFPEHLQKNIEYSITLLAELLETDVPVHVVVKIAKNITNINISTKDFVEYLKLFKLAKLNNIPDETAMNIIVKAISRKLSYKEAYEYITKLKLQMMKEEITKEYIDKQLIHR